MKKSTNKSNKWRFKHKVLAQSLALALGTTLLANSPLALAAAPQVKIYVPEDNSSSSASLNTLSLTFDQNVTAAANKNFVIRKSSDASIVETIAANDTGKVTLKPSPLSASKTEVNVALTSGILQSNIGYYVQIDACAFQNSSNECYVGILDNLTWNFINGASLVATYAPTRGATNVLPSSDLSLTFSDIQAVVAVAGKNIVIKNASADSVVEAIAANDTTKVTVSSSKISPGSHTTKVTINPSNDLLFNSGYYVNIDAGAFSGSLSYAGIADNLSWIFTTAADPNSPSVPAGLTATPVGATKVDLVWSASTDSVGVTAYKVYRGGVLLATLGAVTTYSDTGLTAATTYNYSVSACNAAGNCSTQSTSTVATTASDVQAPTTPTGLKAAATTVSEINLTWTAATDNVGVTAYKVYRGGTLLATLGNVTSYSDTSLSSSTVYSYTVAACDAAGNCSAQSSAVTPPDSIAPSVPTGLTASSSSATQFNLSWTAATDNVGVTAYKVYRSGTLLVTLGNVTSYSDTLSTSTAHSYTVSACDAAGNCSAQSGAATPPDSIAPSVPAGLTVSSASPTQANLSWSAATDNVGVTAYKVYRGGALLTTLGNVTSYNDTGLSTSTSFSYTVAACDAAGNCSAQSSAVALPDTVAPSVPTGMTASSGSTTEVTISWTAATDNVGVTAYKVYRGGTLLATLGSVTSFSDSGLADSTTYSYTISACDAANNCSAQSTAVPITTLTPPDTQAPTVPISFSASAVGTTQTYLSWAASTDNVGVTAYKIYRDGSLLATLAKVTSYTDNGLTASTGYGYTVAACDAAGNCSRESSIASVTTNSPPKPLTTTTEVVSGINENVSVDTSGALVITAKATEPPPTVIIKNDAVINAVVKLPPQQPVNITTNGITNQVTDVSGQSQFLTTNVGGTTQIELVKGQMQVLTDKAGSKVSVTSANSQSTGSLVTIEDKTSVAVVKDETKASVFVDNGKIDYSAGNKTPVSIYQGENSTIDPGGNLTQLALGSQNGQKQVPGDPLPVTSISKDNDTKVPNLEGALPRFDNKLTLLGIIEESLKAILGPIGDQLRYEGYDKTTGVISYALGNSTIRLIALGDILIQLNQFAATNVSATAGGAYALASRGIEMSLSGALGYFTDLQSVVKNLDSNAQLSLKSTGAIELRMAGGHYVVMPGLIANLPDTPTPIPGFESDSSGYAVFRDSKGTLQPLYPSILDVNNLTVLKAVPSLSVTNNGNGTVTAVAPGHTFILRPEYSIVDSPAGHASDLYWYDSGLFYFSYTDQSAQGFRLF